MIAIRSILLRSLLVSSAALLVPGCMSAPDFPRLVSVREVIQNARCELYDAIEANKEKHKWILEWAAGFDFSFVVDRDANVTADTSYLLPVNAGTFTFGLKANFKQKARGTYVVKYKILDVTDYEKVGCPRFARSMPNVLLNGEIGLRRWLDGVIPEIEAASLVGKPRAERRGAGDVTDLSYTIEFGVTADGSLIPSWALAFPDKHQFKPGFNILLSEAVTHKLIVAMTRAAREPKDETGIELKIEEKIDGDIKEKRYIVARRVCLTPQQCEQLRNDVREEKRKGIADADAKVRKAKVTLEIEKKKLKRASEGAKRFTKELENVLPNELKNLPFAKLFDEANKDKYDSRSFFIQNFTKLKQEADRVLGAVEDGMNDVKKAEAAMRAATRRAEEAREEVDRAKEEAERETSRRLDLLIQQQVIRDAFRQ
jgi:hypothetical protein